eukprot:1007075-Rhodomonas_salina.2
MRADTQLSARLNNAHGTAVVQCTVQLVKCCPLLTGTLATALGDGDSIVKLGIVENNISDQGFRPLFNVISHFRSFTGFCPFYDACLESLIDSLPRATILWAFH